MEFIIRIEARMLGRMVETRDVVKIGRVAAGPSAEDLGLALEDGKEILRQIQAHMVRIQVEFLEAAASLCIHCGRRKAIKDKRSRILRTVFGAVRLTCRRFIFCTCRGGKPRNEWPLRHVTGMYSTPEFRYLLAKWGSEMPYRRAAHLLTELFPLPNGGVSHATVRRQTLSVGEHFNQRAIEPTEYDWPDSQRNPVAPAQRITVAIDGTYIRAVLGSGNRQLHVVAGRIDRDGAIGAHFAWIGGETTAQCHMKASLDDNGCTSESRVAVLADGADGLGGIVRAAADQVPRNILDWFHISMRLRHVEQMGPSMAALFPDSETAALLLHRLPNLRYQMWNGQWRAAILRIDECLRGTQAGADTRSASNTERLRRFRKHLIELRQYLISNRAQLTDYGKARRDGLRISSAPAESGMNHLINQRMGKRQPMRWSAIGAHLLLQVRCAVLDHRLETLFREWFPRFRATPPMTPATAA